MKRCIKPSATIQKIGCDCRGLDRLHPILTGVARAVASHGREVVGAIFLTGFAALASATPTNGVVTSGSATISTNGVNGLTIQQSSTNTSINWQSFSIGAGETVRFIQPSSSATAINRVLGSDPSQIFGNLIANGRVFLINPNGVLFGQGASVNVGGLVASTLDLANSDMAAGRFRFTGSGGGEVQNLGSIQAADGGFVALLGNRVSNDGSIHVPGGSVALAAGSGITLDVGSTGLLNVAVDQAALHALARNGGLIEADGGTVYLAAWARDALLDTVVNNTGVIQANSIGQRNGRIYLDGGDSGVVVESGTLRASGVTTDATGGTIVVTGDKVLVEDGANLDARGAAGGGGIYVGGSWQGQDTSIRQATGVYVAPTATLDASATQRGDGGTVVAWSAVHQPGSTTRVYGRLFAKGGPTGGNGGRIETSGHWLDLRGIRINASAPHGNAGLWFLDPEDLTVTGAASTIAPFVGGFGEQVWQSGAGTTNVLNTDIEAQLNAGTSVTLTTAPTGASNGDITITAPITKTAGGNALFMADALGSIILNPGVTISSSAGLLGVTLQAANSVVMGAGSSIATNGDMVIVDAASFVNNAGASAFNTGGGQWFVYANNPGTSFLGGLGSGNPDVYGQTSGTQPPFSLSPGNWYIWASAAPATQPVSTVQASLSTLAGSTPSTYVPVVTGVLIGTNGEPLLDVGAMMQFAQQTEQAAQITFAGTLASPQPAGALPAPPGSVAVAGSLTSPTGAGGGAAAGGRATGSSLGGGLGTPTTVSRLAVPGFAGIPRPSMPTTGGTPTRPLADAFIRGASRAVTAGSASGVMLVSSLTVKGNTAKMVIAVPAGEAFSLLLPKNMMGKLLAKGSSSQIEVSVAGGGALPSWVSLDRSTMTLKITGAPANELPLTVRLRTPSGTPFEVTLQ